MHLIRPAPALSHRGTHPHRRRLCKHHDGDQAIRLCGPLFAGLLMSVQSGPPHFRSFALVDWRALRRSRQGSQAARSWRGGAAGTPRRSIRGQTPATCGRSLTAPSRGSQHAQLSLAQESPLPLLAGTIGQGEKEIALVLAQTLRAAHLVRGIGITLAARWRSRGGIRGPGRARAPLLLWPGSVRAPSRPRPRLAPLTYQSRRRCNRILKTTWCQSATISGCTVPKISGGLSWREAQATAAFGNSPALSAHGPLPDGIPMRLSAWRTARRRLGKGPARRLLPATLAQPPPEMAASGCLASCFATRTSLGPVAPPPSKQSMK